MAEELRTSGATNRKPGETCSLLLDGEGKVLRASDGVRRLFRCAPDELEGSSFKDFLDLAEPFTGEARMLRGDGEAFPALVSVFGVPEGAAVVEVRDLTGEKRVAEWNQARFRALTRSAVDFFGVQKEDGTITYVSPSVEWLLGYEPEEMIGAPVGDFIHPEDFERAWLEFYEILKSPDVYRPLRVRQRHKSGEWRHFEVIVGNLLDDPDVRGLVCHCRDVTEQVRSEEALRESEERFRALVENTTDLITLADPDNTIRYISPASKRILGYEPRELIGTPVSDVLHPEDLWEAARAVMRINNAPGPTEPLRFRFRRKDGTYRTLETIYNNLLDDPSIGGIVCNSRDVTERVEAEEHYRLLVEQVPAVSYTMIPAPEGEPGSMISGSWSYISPRIEQLLGYPPEAFISDPLFWNSLIHPDDLDGVLDEDVRTDETGDVFAMEYRMRHRSGRYLWVKDDAVLIRDEAGGPLLWQCVLVDITRRREAEEEVRRLNQELERMVEDRTTQLMSAMEEAEDNEEMMRLSEGRFRSLVQNASDIVVILDRDFAPVYASPSIEQLLGYTPGEVMERDLAGFVHPADDRRVRDVFRRVASERGETARVEFRFRHGDGSWRHLDVTLNNLSGEAGVDGIVANARDITERKEAEEELRQSLDALLALYETGCVITSTLDLEERGDRLLEILVTLFGLRAARISLTESDGETTPWKSKGSLQAWRAAESGARTGARREAMASGEPRAFRLADGPVEGICLPLKVRERTIGLLEVLGEEGLAAEENLDVFVSLGNQAGSALESARLYTELARREARREELVGKLLTAQEEERRRVSRDIHDGLAQTALAALQHLQAFQGSHPTGSVMEEGGLDRTLELVRRTGREARRVISDLRPTVLDDFGLASALRMHFEALAKDGLHVEYTEDLAGQRLPPHVETALYRVAQEAMNNVRKHSGRARAEVSLGVTKDGRRKVRLEARDGGRGFDSSRAARGGSGERVGLSGMEERIALVDGHFEVESSPGSGTRILAEVPLPETARG